MGDRRRTPFLSRSHCQGWKKHGFKEVFSFFRFLRFLKFLYKDQTRKYDPKAIAHEKQTTHGTPMDYSEPCIRWGPDVPMWGAFLRRKTSSAWQCLTERARSTILLQRNPSFVEMLDQVHFGCRKPCRKMTKYDVRISLYIYKDRKVDQECRWLCLCHESRCYRRLPWEAACCAWLAVTQPAAATDPGQYRLVAYEWWSEHTAR